MNDNPRYFIAIIFIVIGVSALLHINIGGLILPLILILVGIQILRQNPGRDIGKVHYEETGENQLDYSGTFVELNKKVKTDDFNGGKIHLVFAGGTLDLSESKIAKGKTVYLDVNAVFGGAKIIVPSAWVVNTSVVGVFGGFVNNTKIPESSKDSGRLFIKGSAVFGGGEVTN